MSNTKKEQRKGRGSNPKSRANLKPCKQGETHNPQGRPVGSRNVSTVLKEMLETVAPEQIVNLTFVKEFTRGLKLKRVTNADVAAARIFNEAIVQGEAWALAMLLDRTEGKPVQTNEHTGKDGKPIETNTTVVVNFVDKKP